jgi:hypothetical protein
LVVTTLTVDAVLLIPSRNLSRSIIGPLSRSCCKDHMCTEGYCATRVL